MCSVDNKLFIDVFFTLQIIFIRYQNQSLPTCKKITKILAQKWDLRYSDDSEVNLAWI